MIEYMQAISRLPQSKFKIVLLAPNGSGVKGTEAVSKGISRSIHIFYYKFSINYSRISSSVFHRFMLKDAKIIMMWYFRGGINVTFTGTNLDTVHQPKVQFYSKLVSIVPGLQIIYFKCIIICISTPALY